MRSASDTPGVIIVDTGDCRYLSSFIGIDGSGVVSRCCISKIGRRMWAGFFNIDLAGRFVLDALLVTGAFGGLES